MSRNDGETRATFPWLFSSTDTKQINKKTFIRKAERENTMQRTVKGTRVHLAKMEMVDGSIAIAETKTETYANTDEKTAVKKATKANIGYGVISTETFEQKYILDDEIFFKYAVAVTPEEKTENNADT